MSDKLFSCHMEIYGKFSPDPSQVRSISEKGHWLGLRGYIILSKQGIINGKAQGTADKIEEFEEALTDKAHFPQIERVHFSELTEIPNFSYDGFDIRD